MTETAKKVYRGTSGTKYITVGQRDGVSLLVSLFRDAYGLKASRLVVRFAASAADGQYGEYFYLTPREQADLRDEDSKQSIPIVRMNKFDLKVVSHSISIGTFVEVVRRKVAPPLAALILDVMKKEGFTTDLNETTLAAELVNLITPTDPDYELLFKIEELASQLTQHAPKGVVGVPKFVSAYTPPEDEDEVEDEDESEDEE
jgi:hypothetical protein